MKTATFKKIESQIVSAFWHELSYTSQLEVLLEAATGLIPSKDRLTYVAEDVDYLMKSHEACALSASPTNAYLLITPEVLLNII